MMTGNPDSKPLPSLSTAHLQIWVLAPQDYVLLMEYEHANRQHLAKWEPLRPNSYFNAEQTRIRVKQHFDDALNGRALHLVAKEHENQSIMAVCHFSNIVYGPFQACNMGYSIDYRYQGQGLMYEMVSRSIDYVFTHLNLHRIMASYMTDNIRSEHLLQRLGFVKEGFAQSYLHIAGQWQDHILTAKINPNHQPT
ncbi:GNAT family N-acetyltransferase [Neptunicella sp.]|uniref:GNAT family N-acetyltransferase n=1 Tax=Neptunicella sp. TaxID=2125986 RepID=UPI003F6907A9